MADQAPQAIVGGVHYRVTPERVQQASQDTALTAGRVSADIQALRAYAEQLGQAWQGPAHAQFEILMKEFDTYARMLNDALMGISKGLEGNYINYKESEAQNLSNLTALGVDIPTPSSGTQFAAMSERGANFS
ncbi:MULTISPECIES: WXG100 family type VII secretion target [Streptomyces]|uniref:WXG100 family type VII secretion target n=1 Tax=Streptomyces TaxID=1883 RepID=UPI0004BD5EBB|nr:MULTISPECIES: WXG100 family type VII secretion target [Streptomyces]KPC94379.1 CFP-10-like protein [Streptomyces sp. NRRL F-6602]QID37323.1 WXG100 family type VII secretion target [Streptomyces albus]